MSAESTLRGLLLVSVVLFAFPRANYPRLPFGISGLDFCAGPVLLGLILVLAQRGRIGAPRSLFLGYVLAIPFIFLWSNLVAFMFHQDNEALVRGVLQSVRRFPAVLFLLLAWQTTLQQSHMARLFKALVLSTFLGAGLFILLANGLLGQFTPRTDLLGNPVSFLAAALNLPVISRLLTDYRFAGNTGSPTTYGLICGIEMLVLLSMYRRHLVGKVFFYLASTALFLLLLASAAKAVLAVVIPLYLFLLLRYWGPALLIIPILFSAVLVRQGPTADVAGTLWSLGASSFHSRLGIYDMAADEVATHTNILLFGEGWRSREVGWHSEIAELVMGLGLPLGMLSIGMVYIYTPWYLLNIRSSPRSLFTSGTMLAVYGVIAASSLFQDIFHDSNILFTFSVLIIALLKGSETGRGVVREGIEDGRPSGTSR